MSNTKPRNGRILIVVGFFTAALTGCGDQESESPFVPRVAASKPASVVVVRPGAQGSGVAVSLEEALTRVADGGRILLTPGTYEELVVVNKSVTIEGVGPPGSVRLYNDPALFQDFTIWVIGAEAKVRNVHFDGGSPFDVAVLVTDGGRVNLEDVSVNVVQIRAVGGDVHMSGSALRNVMLDIRSGASGVLTDNVFDRGWLGLGGDTGPCVGTAFGGALHATRNRFLGCADAIDVQPTSAPAVIRFNDFEDNDGALQVFGTPGVDATCNWWGAPDGPSGFGLTGSGDELRGILTATVWEPFATSPIAGSDSHSCSGTS
jgi:hypothetical protein